MLNNLRLAFRHLGRQKFNTMLHIVGLTISSIIIALTTVSFQAIKAALSNPVESLRNE